MTKEQIFEDVYAKSEYTHPARPVIHKAMEEYAKQQSIVFGKHLQFFFLPCAETGCFTDRYKDPIGKNPLTTEQVYIKFLSFQEEAIELGYVIPEE
jgi:hypothetical protein